MCERESESARIIFLRFVSMYENAYLHFGIKEARSSLSHLQNWIKKQGKSKFAHNKERQNWLNIAYMY